MRVTATRLDGLVPHQFPHCQNDKTIREGVLQAMPSESRNTSFLYGSLKPLARFRQFESVAVEKDCSLPLPCAWAYNRAGTAPSLSSTCLIPPCLLCGIVMSLFSRSMFSQTMQTVSRPRVALCLSIAPQTSLSRCPTRPTRPVAGSF